MIAHEQVRPLSKRYFLVAETILSGEVRIIDRLITHTEWPTFEEAQKELSDLKRAIPHAYIVEVIQNSRGQGKRHRFWL